MAMRATAGVLLISVSIWAEMALAPMLAMHAGHMRAGHEMAADMSAEHGAHHAQPPEEMDHPCCPRTHNQTSANTLEIAAGAPLCADPHSCCFRQGPQSVPAPAREPEGNDKLSKHPLAALLALTIPANKRTSREPSNCFLALSPPADAFGMTLRV